MEYCPICCTGNFIKDMALRKYLCFGDVFLCIIPYERMTAAGKDIILIKN